MVIRPGLRFNRDRPHGQLANNLNNFAAHLTEFLTRCHP